LQLDRRLVDAARYLSFSVGVCEDGVTLWLQNRTKQAWRAWLGDSGVGGTSALPTVLICRKSGQNPWKPGKNLSKYGQNGTQRFFVLKKWRPAFAENGHTPKITPKKVFMIFEGESHTKTYWASLEKFGQKSFAPQKIFLLQHLCSVNTLITIWAALGRTQKLSRFKATSGLKMPLNWVHFWWLLADFEKKIVCHFSTWYH